VLSCCIDGGGAMNIPKVMQRHPNAFRFITGSFLVLFAIQHLWAVSSGNPTANSKTNIRDITNSQLGIAPNESTLAYVKRITQMVNTSTYHCAPNLYRLSWIETALNPFFFTHIRSEGILARSRFTCGYCSQRTAVTASILNSSGIDAKAMGLDGHVVVRFIEGGQEYFSDPDYGVGPYRYVQDAKIMHSTIKHAYSAAKNWAVIEKIVVSFDDNRLYDSYFLKAEWRQTLMFFVAKILAYCSLAIGLLLTASSLFLRRRQMRHSEIPHDPRSLAES
jgi:hypothetical protein